MFGRINVPARPDEGTIKKLLRKGKNVKERAGSFRHVRVKTPENSIQGKDEEAGKTEQNQKETSYIPFTGLALTGTPETGQVPLSNECSLKSPSKADYREAPNLEIKKGLKRDGQEGNEGEMGRKNSKIPRIQERSYRVKNYVALIKEKRDDCFRNCERNFDSKSSRKASKVRIGGKKRLPLTIGLGSLKRILLSRRGGVSFGLAQVGFSSNGNSVGKLPDSNLIRVQGRPGYLAGTEKASDPAERYHKLRPEQLRRKIL